MDIDKTHVLLQMECSLADDLAAIAKRENIPRASLMRIFLRAGAAYARTASVFAPVKFHEETLADMAF
jgi:hypothetical protein